MNCFSHFISLFDFPSWIPTKHQLRHACLGNRRISQTSIGPFVIPSHQQNELWMRWTYLMTIWSSLTSSHGGGPPPLPRNRRPQPARHQSLSLQRYMMILLLFIIVVNLTNIFICLILIVFVCVEEFFQFSGFCSDRPSGEDRESSTPERPNGKKSEKRCSTSCSRHQQKQAYCRGFRRHRCFFFFILSSS